VLEPVIVNVPVRFRAVASTGGSPGTFAYSWAWGPNRPYDTPTAEPVVTHIFKRAGAVLVEVLVTDARGDRVTATRRIIVAASHRPGTDPRSRDSVRRAADPAGHAAAAETVVIKDFNFGPPTITVHPGETVTWVNQGPSSHTATGHGSFQTGILRPGQSAGHVFTAPGTYSYFCSIHPFMHGTVVVLASVSATPTEHQPASPKAAGSGAAERTAAGPELPNTGLNLTVESVSGLGLVALGLLLLAVSRRRGAVNRGSEPGAKIPPPGGSRPSEHRAASERD
jgi:LPXTG-motif cell wall-anchored protein